jgi:Pyruvate/2-oxoacid:ferredoxin oxidoreductase delta subunit
MNHVKTVYPDIDEFCIDDYHPIAKIYHSILSAEEAGFLMRLTDRFVSSAQFASENVLGSETAERMLDNLSEKGVVFSKKICGVLHYQLTSYFPELADAIIAKGINNDISGYIQEYIDLLNQKSDNNFITLPVNKKINFEIQHISYEEVMLYLDQTDSYALTDCLCRSMNLLNNRACGHPIKDMCIQTGTYADYFVRTGRARSASRHEVEEVLRQAEAYGLYHEIFLYDSTNSNVFICNCCPCGCISMNLSGRIRAIVEKNENSPLDIDIEKCIGCRECISNCPGQALVWSQNEGKPALQANECFSCGMCAAVCRQKAITIL